MRRGRDRAGETARIGLSCPSKADIIGFFEQTLSDADDRRVLDHMLRCPDCRTVFSAAAEICQSGRGILREFDGKVLDRDARRILKGSARREVELLRRGRGVRAVFPRWAVIPAAAVGLVIAVMIFLKPLSGPRPLVDIERRAPAEDIRLVAPRGTVSAAGLDFRWTPVAGAREYHLEIYDRALDPVFISGVIRTESLALPASGAAVLRDGLTYFWKVVTTVKDGRTVDSEFAKFVFQK